MNEKYILNVYVTKDDVVIANREKIHTGEYKSTKCVFNFTEDYEGLTKKAIFETEDVIKEMPIISNECDIPEEVLQDGYLQCNLRVYGYDIEEVDGEMTVKLRYSPTYDTFPIYKGSFIPNAEQGEEITPTQFEQYSAALNEGLEEVNEKLIEIDNLDVDVSKTDNVSIIEVTKKDGTTKTVQVLDGAKGDKGDTGETGSRGPAGENGRDGAIQYTAGANITIENNVISANIDGNYESLENKVTSLSSSSTDTQYPSAKCVYDLVGDIETLLEEI